MGMSLCTLGLSKEWEKDKIAVNSLWPKRAIVTAATRMLMGDKGIQATRKPEIVSEAVYKMLITPSTKLTGQFLLDEDFLRTHGVKDFSQYNNNPGVEPLMDFYVE
jgi:citronellol/citronellal dehydrogenase